MFPGAKRLYVLHLLHLSLERRDKCVLKIPIAPMTTSSHLKLLVANGITVALTEQWWIVTGAFLRKETAKAGTVVARKTYNKEGCGLGEYKTRWDWSRRTIWQEYTRYLEAIDNETIIKLTVRWLLWTETRMESSIISDSQTCWNLPSSKSLISFPIPLGKLFSKSPMPWSWFPLFCANATVANNIKMVKVLKSMSKTWSSKFALSA